MKTREINIMHTILMLFVFLAPVCASAFEKTVAVYASLGLFTVYAGYRIFKDGYLVVTRSALVLTLMAGYSFLQLIWVSDKGSQCALASLFLVAAAGSLMIADYKKRIGSENFKTNALRLIYSASLFYTVMAILHQIFIESRFWDCSMSFGAGSGDTSAFVAVIGIAVTLKLFGKYKKQKAFYVAMPLMVYMLIMSKSLIGYLFAAVVYFGWAMTHRHKKAEAFLALVACVALGIINVINAVAVLVTNSGYFNGAIKGMVSVFGIGCGGYNATAEIVGKGYEGFTTTFNLLGEAYGIVGFVFMALMIAEGVILYRREKRFANLLMLIFTVAIIVSSSATLAFTLPVICMCYASCEESVEFNTGKPVALVLVVPLAFSALFTLAHIPYTFAKHQCDLGNYSKGGAYYAVGAGMEIFNSHGWEKAYGAYMQSTEEPSYSAEKALIEKAIKFNRKNYAYYRDLAEVYSKEGDYLNALEVWDTIILRHDKEYLYPVYGAKIVDVMAHCPLGLEKTTELFNKLDTYAKKATDKEIIFEMNNLLARSQQYYVNAREGGQVAGDMYVDTEEFPEVEYESGSAES